MAVHVDASPPHEITVEGHVEETRVFGPQIRMETCITTVPGSNQLVVRDEFKNLKDQPVEMQLLYHWNFGPPFLEAGARFQAPIKSVTPRDGASAEALAGYSVYEGPRPGFAEQVYYFELHGDAAASGRTLVLLRNHQGDKGVVLRFGTDQLPAFTLWKNTAGLRDGYVTGLEPGTNYPNPRPFEQSRNRVVRAAGRWELCHRDHGGCSRHRGRGCWRRARDRQTAGAGRGQDQPAADRAVCA